MQCVENAKFDQNGLIPVIIQDYSNDEVLMLAYMNKESLIATLDTGKTHFFSRSRQKLWLKGESSGHVQTIKEIYLDCDHDTLLIKVEQCVAACHTGYRSCFHKRFEGETLNIVGKKCFDETKVYENKSTKNK